jgi:hypothetical protein
VSAVYRQTDRTPDSGGIRNVAIANAIVRTVGQKQRYAQQANSDTEAAALPALHLPKPTRTYHEFGGASFRQ